MTFEKKSQLKMKEKKKIKSLAHLKFFLILYISHSNHHLFELLKQFLTIVEDQNSEKYNSSRCSWENIDMVHESTADDLEMS